MNPLRCISVCTWIEGHCNCVSKWVIEGHGRVKIFLKTSLACRLLILQVPSDAHPVTNFCCSWFCATLLALEIIAVAYVIKAEITTAQDCKTGFCPFCCSFQVTENTVWYPLPTHTHFSNATLWEVDQVIHAVNICGKRIKFISSVNIPYGVTGKHSFQYILADEKQWEYDCSYSVVKERNSLFQYYSKYITR